MAELMLRLQGYVLLLSTVESNYSFVKHFFLIWTLNLAFQVFAACQDTWKVNVMWDFN